MEKSNPSEPAILSPHEMTGAQMDQFLSTGEMIPRDADPDPKPAEADKDAEAAAAEPVDQAASTEVVTKAGTEPAEPGKKTGKKLSAKERADELERETAADAERLQAALRKRREVREALAEAERDETPKPKQADKPGEAASPATDPKDPAWKKYRAMPDAPKVSDKDSEGNLLYESLEDYSAAMGLFIAEKIADERFDAKFTERSEQSARELEQAQEFDGLVGRALERAKVDAEADPTIYDRIDPRWKSVRDVMTAAECKSPVEFVKHRVSLFSKRPLKVAEFFSSPEGEKELARICQIRDTAEMISEIAYVDARFTTGTQDSTADEPPQPSRISKAPAPAPALGRKAASGKDPLKAAIDAGDFEAFNKLETDRELARGH